MAYRRSTRTSRRSRRGGVRRRTTRTTRRSRPYRARRTRVSRRAILNITSTKKQDNMLSTNPSGLPGGYSGGSATFLFCPSFRQRAVDVSGETEDATAARLTQSTYVRGIKEKIYVTTAGGSPVRWRRIVYETKNRATNITAGSYQATLPADVRVRPMQVQTPGSILAIAGHVMAGVIGTDYLSLINGKPDPNKVRVYRDNTYTLNPGNATGHAKEHTFWTGINGTLTYADNEAGNDEVSSPWAEEGRMGLGNIFILDIFDIAITTTPPTEVSFVPQTTYYWHER